MRSSLNPLFARLPALLLLGGLCTFLAACPGNPDDPVPTDCPPDSVATWDNFGEPFLLTWCTPCHSSHLSGFGDPNERQDAPLGSDFDTYSHYMDWDTDVYARAAAENTSMPPAGGPTPEDRAMLAEWIACGSPE